MKLEVIHLDLGFSVALLDPTMTQPFHLISGMTLLAIKSPDPLVG